MHHGVRGPVRNDESWYVAADGTSVTDFTFYDRGKLSDLRVEGIEHPKRWSWTRTLTLTLIHPGLTVRLPL